MVLNLLERYVFRKMLVLLLAIFSALVGVVWVVRAIQEIDVVMTKGQSIGLYLQITSLGVPTLAAAIAPVSLLIAAMQTINSLSTDSEMVVMHAAGASRRALLKPFLLTAGLVAVLVYSLLLFFGPASMQKLRGYVTEMRADLIATAVREGAFRDFGKGMTMHVASRTSVGVLQGVFLLDGREQEEEILTYLAKTGTVVKTGEGTFLILEDGQIQRRSSKDDKISIIEFDSYGLNLANLSTDKKSSSSSQMEISTYDLLNPDPSAEYYQKRPGAFRAELHARLTGGLYPFAVVLIIVAFIGYPASNRQGQTVRGMTAALTFVGLRVLGILFESALRKDPSMVIFVWAVPISGIIIPSVAIASGRAFRLPKRISATLDSAKQSVGDLASSLRAALPGGGQKAEAS